MKKILAVMAAFALLGVITATASAHRPAVSVTKRMAHDKLGQWCWTVFPTDPFEQRCSGYGLNTDAHSTNPHSVIWYKGYARNGCGRLYYPIRVRAQYAAHGGTKITDIQLAAQGHC